MADVLLPQLGETVTEGTITRWFFGIGERVPADAPLYEVSTEKVDSEVPSPLGGVLVEIIASEGATVAVGALLCRIDADGPSSTSPLPTPPAVAGDAPADAAGATSSVGTPPTPADGSGAQAVGAGVTGGGAGGRARVRLLSPVIRRLLAENGLDPERVRGTGLGGRLTRRDVEQFLRDNPGRAEPFNGIRKATARHMVGSKATSPHVLTAMEVDFDAVDRLRSVTVTNPGQYGTLFQFPIINQPQVAILSTDGVARKPAVVVDADGVETVGVRPLGILALAWDHRAFDGAYAAAFLQDLKRILETTDWVGRWADEADGT